MHVNPLLYIRTMDFICCCATVSLSLPAHPVEVMGLYFPNPVGLAAGFARDGTLVPSIACAGFGFVEIGTINADSEKGRDDELTGLRQTLPEVRRQPDLAGPVVARPLLGISVGSLRDPVDEHTVADIVKGMAGLWRYADYLIINLSRPGSAARAQATGCRPVRKLLEKIRQTHAVLARDSGYTVPLALKVAMPHHNGNSNVPEALVLARELGFDGVLAAFENWPDRNSVNQCIQGLTAAVHPLPLMAVGGIRSVEDARDTFKAGAALVQLFTVMAEQRPLQIRKMIMRLVAGLDAQQIKRAGGDCS